MQKKNKLSEPSYLRLLLRSFLSSSKIYIYLTYLKNKFNLPENITHNDTDIVVEGYPRTGNSYLYLLIKQINPKIKIYGIQTKKFPTMYNFFKSKQLRVTGDTLADGIAVKMPGNITSSIIQKYVDDIILVNELTFSIFNL